MVAAANSNAPHAAETAVNALLRIAIVGADLAARIISTQGAPLALSQAALHCGDVRVGQRATAVLTEAAHAGPEHASTIATPDVLAALVSALGNDKAGAGKNCMAVLCSLACASPPLAMRVSDTPGAEAALLAALASSDLEVARNATITISRVALADAERAFRLLSAPEVPPALARLLQSNAPMEATACEVLNLFVLLRALLV